MILLRLTRSFKAVVRDVNIRLISKISPNTIRLSEKIQQAKLENRPIVALESTIITHGMPYPKNLETALQVEHIIQEKVPLCFNSTIYCH